MSEAVERVVASLDNLMVSLYQTHPGLDELEAVPPTVNVVEAKAAAIPAPVAFEAGCKWLDEARRPWWGCR